jgi:hypothetical protein
VVTQHASLSPDRWSRFTLDQQILMIANEMNRTGRVPDGDAEGLQRGYERVLRLTDLTAAGPIRPAMRRELLRWRDLVAQRYLQGLPDRPEHEAAFRALLLLTPTAAKQIPYLLR